MDVYQRRQNGYGRFLVQKTLKGTKVVFELHSEIYICFRTDREYVGMRVIDKCGCGFKDICELFK